MYPNKTRINPNRKLYEGGWLLCVKTLAWLAKHQHLDRLSWKLKTLFAVPYYHIAHSVIVSFADVTSGAVARQQDRFPTDGGWQRPFLVENNEFHPYYYPGFYDDVAESYGWQDGGWR